MIVADERLDDVLKEARDIGKQMNDELKRLRAALLACEDPREDSHKAASGG